MEKHTTSQQKPTLTFAQILNMSVGFIGIQLGFSLQNANVSRIFETLGAAVDDIPILWIAAPLTGLILQPIVGYLSDRTWHKRWGRRRPFFFIGAISASLALAVIPNSPSLWMAALVLWIMDASLNITMEPFRAFVGDNLSSTQRRQGFTMQTFFIGIGAVIGSALPAIMTNWFGVNNIAAPNEISLSLKFSFMAGAIIYISSVLYTIATSKEYSPQELDAFEKYEQTKNSKQYAASNTLTEDLPQTKRLEKARKMLQYGLVFIGLSGLLTIIVTSQQLNRQLYAMSGILGFAGICFALAYQMVKSKRNNGFTTIMIDLLSMPKTMQQLAWVQFFTWFGLFSMWIYMTQAVTSHIYNTTDTTSQAYNDGADFIGILFAFYNALPILIAFLLPIIAKKISNRMTHMMALLLGGLGLVSIYFITDPQFLFVPMIGIGIAWSSIMSIPYSLLANALPAKKMGYYMGVFNFFIVIPQLVAAGILGFLISYFFEGQAIFALVIGGLSMILAGFLMLRVKENNA